MKRQDYKCDKCGNVQEEVITEASREIICEKCGHYGMQIVFKSPPQVRVEHASSVLHFAEKNKQRMREIYEEDAAEKSDFNKYMDDMRETVYVDG